MYMQKLQKLSMEFCKKVDNYVTNPTTKNKKTISWKSRELIKR